MYRLNAPVVTFALMTTGAFSRNGGRLFSKLKLACKFTIGDKTESEGIFTAMYCAAEHFMKLKFL